MGATPQTTAQLPAQSMFAKTPAYELDDGTVVFGLRLPTILPASSDRALTVTGPITGRLDLIAAQLVQADAAWWTIADNSNLMDPLFGVNLGSKLRIPLTNRLPT